MISEQKLELTKFFFNEMKISLPFSTDSISSMQTDDRILFLGFALLLLDILKLTKAGGLVSVCLHKVTYLVAPQFFKGCMTEKSLLSYSSVLKVPYCLRKPGHIKVYTVWKFTKIAH